MIGIGISVAINNYRENYIPVSIPSGFLVTPPFEIQQSGTSYRVDPDFDLETYANISVTKTYYVDSVNGSDSNTGLSWAQAFKTLSKIQSQGDADLVYIAENSYFQKNQRSTQYTRNIKFIGLGSGATRPKITADINNQTGSFSVHSGNCYKANITEFCGYAYDNANLNSFGNPTSLSPAASIAACIATPNTFFTDWPNTDVYVNLFDGRVPDSNLIFGDGTCMAVTADNRKQYFENIIFGSTVIYQNSTSTGNLKGYFKNCLIKGTIAGVTEFIIQDCDTYSRLGEDCMNYDVRNTLPTIAYELNCNINTQALGTSNTQASTTHNNCTIVRVGGSYYSTGGQNMADVTGGQSWVLGSEMYSSNSGIGCFFSLTKVWLDGVYIHDNSIGIQIQGTCQGYYRNLRNLATTPTDVAGTASFTPY
jgi:hypothetical protein